MDTPTTALHDSPLSGAEGADEARGAGDESWADDANGLDLDDATTRDAAEADDDTDDDAGDDTGVDEETDPASASGAAATETGKTRATLSRGQVRRVALKAEEVSSASARTRAAVAAMVGSGTDLVDLTTAIMVADRGVSRPISDLKAISEADPFDAAVDALALGRTRMRGAWTVLVALGKGEGALATNDRTAAKDVAGAALRLDDSAKSDLEALAALLRKH